MQRARQSHKNNFTEDDARDVKLARAFFKKFSSGPSRTPEVEVALGSLLPAITRFKALLHAEFPEIRNPEYPPDMVIIMQLDAPRLSLNYDSFALKNVMRVSGKHLEGLEDKHVYGMIKDIWMPESLKPLLREGEPDQPQPE
jgi:hypothetical protein